MTQYTAPDLSEHSLRVAAFDFNIKIEPDALMESDGSWAKFNPRLAVIQYQTNWPNPAKFIDSLLHEIGHTIFWTYGLEDEDKEERIVSIQATAWTQIYRDNPWLLKLIQNVLV